LSGIATALTVKDVNTVAKSYAILVSAEIQEMMTKHAISGCEHGGDDSLNDEVIN